MKKTKSTFFCIVLILFSHNASTQSNISSNFNHKLSTVLEQALSFAPFKQDTIMLLGDSLRIKFLRNNSWKFNQIIEIFNKKDEELSEYCFVKKNKTDTWSIYLRLNYLPFSCGLVDTLEYNFDNTNDVCLRCIVPSRSEIFVDDILFYNVLKNEFEHLPIIKDKKEVTSLENVILDKERHLVKTLTYYNDSVYNLDIYQIKNKQLKCIAGIEISHNEGEPLHRIFYTFPNGKKEMSKYDKVFVLPDKTWYDSLDLLRK